MQEARAYAEENGLFFIETSAKAATNVNEIFHEIGNTNTYLLKYSVSSFCYNGHLSEVVKARASPRLCGSCLMLFSLNTR